jgi:hypothetical protein
MIFEKFFEITCLVSNENDITSRLLYDVFTSPIKETAGFQGLQKCGWS